MTNELTLEDINKYDDDDVKKSLQLLYKYEILTQENIDLIIHRSKDAQAIYKALRLMDLLGFLREKDLQEIIKADDPYDYGYMGLPILQEKAHSRVLDLGRRLGYDFTEGGLCNGITLRWMEACFLGEENKFVERIHQIITDYPQNLKDSITAVKEKVKKEGEKNLTEQEIDTIEIQAFYESLFLYQSPMKTDIFDKYHPQQDIEPISQVAASEKILEKGGLKEVYSEPCIFTREEIIEYLNGIKDCINKANIKVGTGILLPSNRHMMALFYQPGNDSWRFMDINKWPPKEYKADQLENLADEIQSSLRLDMPFGNPYTGIDASVISLANNEMLHELSVKLNELKRSHKVTKEVAQRKTQDGVTLAYLACARGDVDKIHDLAKYGFDFNIQEENGTTPAAVASSNGHVSVIVELAKHGANFNIQNKKGITPGLIAAQNGHADVISELAKHGANFDIPNDMGETPAMAASSKGHINVIAELAKQGVDFNIQRNDGLTAAWAAAQNGHAGVIAELAKHGVDFNIPDNRGQTPAWVAARHGHVNVLIELAKQGVDLNKPDKRGETPAEVARTNGYGEKVLPVLEKNRIKVELRDKLRGEQHGHLGQEAKYSFISKSLQVLISLHPLVMSPLIFPLWMCSKKRADVERELEKCTGALDQLSKTWRETDWIEEIKITDSKDEIEVREKIADQIENLGKSVERLSMDIDEKQKKSPGY